MFVDASMFVNACGMMSPMSSAAVAVTTDDLAACCSPVTGGIIDTPTAERVAAVFKALADPARVKLLSLISAAGEACVCDLTEPLELAQPTVSHHMKILVDVGLVSREQRGKWAYYWVNDDALDRVAQLISPTH